MTLDDVSDPIVRNPPRTPQPFLAAPQPEADHGEEDRDIFLIPAPPPAAWPRVFPGL